MSHLSTTIHVDAPPEIIYDLVADPARGPEWQTLHLELGAVAGRPAGVGSSYTAYYRVAGRRIEGHFVITAAERPRIFQAAGTTRGGWARWTTLIEPVDDGADVKVTLEFELPGEIVGGLVGLLSGPRIERAFHRTYANLKRVAEANAARAPTPAAVASGGPAATVGAK